MSKNFAHLGGLNAYEVLGVKPTATTEEIEAAYRSAIKRQHSDTGGVTRLAQLVNDARDALVTDRASYDVWLRTRGPVAEAKPDPKPKASASNPWGATSTNTSSEPEEDFWDPWETVKPPPPPPTPPREPPRRKQPSSPTYPAPDRPTASPEEVRRAYLAVLLAVLCGPLGLWLGFRSYRRARSAPAIVAIVIGGMSVLYLVSLAIALLLGVFTAPSTTG
jgi:DnaJ domain